ncbi:Probable pectinesterase/pectinesterase inhibitor 59 [Striga hermonthica]|uniref:Pectinesterase n=1 Tax=Striga hermonthica TaxID=68872 RepID=A0A9N7NH50_STRHE|nr:Probable pectinesterase/pectinesterase inhibitor 59 [Striga hermonthica]
MAASKSNTNNLIAILLLLLSLIFIRAASSKDITWWCGTTPHPGPCTHFMAHYTAPRSPQDFRTMTIQAALDRSLEAQSDAWPGLAHCRSKRKAVVLRDCNNLMENTVVQLNTTLQSIRTNASFTGWDVQTWLSTALTNIEICRSGSHDLNLMGFRSPILSGNVSELISNSLATNGALLEKNSTSGGYFPQWVTRRMLVGEVRADAVVSKSRRGEFRSVQAAVEWAVGRRRPGSRRRVVVHVRGGVYRENVLIGRTMNNVMLVGDGLRRTVITGARSVTAGFTTYSSATVGVDGIGFIARGITFRNTAGPRSGQAVALRSASDLSVFYACSFEGYQDTLFVHAQRQFYKSCYIYGTIDFIFGNAAVVFQNCVIYVRRPVWGQANVITAQGRGDPFQNTGISIHNSRIMPAPDLRPVARSYRTYLGRPWQQYSRTVIMKSFIDGFVSGQGWSQWEDSNFALTTLYYGEYRNFGPGGSTRSRVRWPGHHVITSSNVAARFTVGSLIAGRAWLPSTGVPFTPGL